ncbi:MAG: hypothetical protein KGI27_02185 [Thaumarchaeota archaeon]|nr:hypothetical protein [Nitrososphaerota archaeon]
MAAIDFNSTLSLLAAYYIPAQSVERFMEYYTKIKNSLKMRYNMDLYDSQIESMKKMRDQTVTKFCQDGKTKVTKTTEQEKNTMTKHSIDEITNNDDPIKFYEHNLHKIDEKIAEYSKDSDREKTRFAIRMWEYGTIMSFVPGGLFAYFGLGILQMSNLHVSENIQTYFPLLDTILNSLFIGSGTKPIHDTIDAIMSIKKS